MTELFRRRLPRAVLGLAMVWAGVPAGRAQQDTGQDKGQAIDRLRQEIAANPERLDLVLALGNTAAGAGKFEMAIASFQKVLENLEPESEGAGYLHLRIGETYRRKGDAEAAIASLTRASTLLPDRPAVLGTLALVLDGSGKKEEAERAYRATLQLDPDNAIAMNNLAFLLAERGEDLDHALGFARRAGELMPEDADMIDTAGWVQMKRKQTDAALGLFAQAWGKAPGNEGYRQHLLLALAGKAEGNAAMDELKALLAGESSAANVRKISDLLKSMERGATR
jgi:tetratricopeptide (TPR) repeat protein